VILHVLLTFSGTGDNVTFGLAGCTAVVQHVGRVLAALVAVCPRNAPVVPVLAEIFKYHLQMCNVFTPHTAVWLHVTGMRCAIASERPVTTLRLVVIALSSTDADLPAKETKTNPNDCNKHDSAFSAAALFV